MPVNFEKYIQDRNQALTNLDMEWARKQMPDASNDFVLLMTMHKARYECFHIAENLRHQSANWLHINNCNRLDGTPLLPLGALPFGGGL